MKLGSVAAFAAFLLSSALPQTAGAQAPLPGQPYFQMPIPWVPGAGAPRHDGGQYDHERREHCEGLRNREHELRERLAYEPPYSKERGHLEDRLRHVRYERERCWNR
jgi:hypothetical protein